MTDYRELCAELVERAPDARRMDGIQSWEALLDRASAALAQPTSPTDGEVEKLVVELNRAVADSVAVLEREAEAAEQGNLWMAPSELRHASTLLRQQQLRIALLEQRQAAPLAQCCPTPVPVADRPWEREGWCNEQGKCWLQGKVEGDWRLIDPLNSGVPNLKYCFTFSLPAHALPLPAENNQS